MSPDLLDRIEKVARDCNHPGGIGLLDDRLGQPMGRVMVPADVLLELVARARAAAPGRPDGVIPFPCATREVSR